MRTIFVLFMSEFMSEFMSVFMSASGSEQASQPKKVSELMSESEIGEFMHVFGLHSV